MGKNSETDHCDNGLCGPTILLQHNPGAFFLETVIGILDQALGKQSAPQVTGLLTHVKQESQKQKWADSKRERSHGHCE
jgi:hypothetical protein